MALNSALGEPVAGLPVPTPAPACVDPHGQQYSVRDIISNGCFVEGWNPAHNDTGYWIPNVVYHEHQFYGWDIDNTIDPDSGVMLWLLVIFGIAIVKALLRMEVSFCNWATDRRPDWVEDSYYPMQTHCDGCGAPFHPSDHSCSYCTNIRKEDYEYPRTN